jgi:hypothetical protein
MAGVQKFIHFESSSGVLECVSHGLAPLVAQYDLRKRGFDFIWILFRKNLKMSQEELELSFYGIMSGFVLF